jgi:hypothetical protein
MTPRERIANRLLAAMTETGVQPSLDYVLPLADAVLEEIAPLLVALSMYADPDSYFAIAIWGDEPCGEFADDYGPDDEFPDYDRPMHGKLARDALRAWRGLEE